MAKTGAIITVVVIIAASAGLYFFLATPTPTSTVRDDLLNLFAPKADDLIKSPLHIEGEARGNWYFEASFPVRLIDNNGKLLGIMPAQAQSDWMTTEFVLFKADLVFTAPTAPSGILILEKDNSSGLPENADERRVPVRFDLSGIPQRAVKLYYYNPTKDQGAGGAQCSRNGLEPVERNISVTDTPIQDVIRMLLKGRLTDEERTNGITTEYPLDGFELTGATLKNGELTLVFRDPQTKTGGGACRVGILWFQIEATAKQFPKVKSVRFAPEELFQP